jgi:two-component system CheB/CheR fusion protein
VVKFRSNACPPGQNEVIRRNLEEITLRKQASSWLQNAHAELERRVGERTVMLLEGKRSLEAEIELRQRAEEAHLQALRRLVDAQETERSRLSRELHDQMSQELTALKLGLKSVHKEGSLSSIGEQHLLQLEEMADLLMQKVHHLAWELRPPLTRNGFGLELALRDYATAWSRHSGVPVDYHDCGTKAPRITPNLELILYRVTQEALTNVARHANARHVSVILECRTGCGSLIVEDDGQGFDAHKVLDSPGRHGRLGFLGMQERVISTGGVIHIESARGVGTTVYVRIPLDKKSIASNQP